MSPLRVDFTPESLWASLPDGDAKRAYLHYRVECEAPDGAVSALVM